MAKGTDTDAPQASKKGNELALNRAESSLVNKAGGVKGLGKLREQAVACRDNGMAAAIDELTRKLQDHNGKVVVMEIEQRAEALQTGVGRIKGELTGDGGGKSSKPTKGKK